ncbi:MerR family transcriptional regulator [Nonomuraea sp. NPDC049400]|uniref:MerR family transcriptional regulator n=1 Tax=Nonomuraea sp. NPDC049400 TaxID=3364352 RepID=UPI003795D982
MLRHWEATGLLTPAAPVSGRRRYTRDHLIRVVTIIRAKAGGNEPGPDRSPRC